jgi:hypothetical protein
MKVVIVVALAFALVGCGSGDISAVKDLPFPADTSFTTSQALDNRAQCEDTDWSAFEDERGRSVVEFTCTLRGAEEYFANELKQRLASLDNRQRSADGYMASILKSADEEIARLQGELAPSTNADQVPDTVLGNLRNYVSLIESGTISRDQTLRLIQIGSGNQWAADLLNAFEDRDAAKERWEQQNSKESRDYLQPDLDAKEAALAEELRRTAEKAREVLALAESDLVERNKGILESNAQYQADLRNRLADAIAKREKLKQEYANNSSNNQGAVAETTEKLQALYQDVHAIESYQWAITASGPEFVYGGIEVRNADEALRKSDYSEQTALRQMRKALSDSITSIPEYYRP